MSQTTETRVHELVEEDFVRLLDFRDGLRQFLRWSQESAREAEITPAQHQLLLAVKGHRGTPRIADIADHLMLRHHSAVELVDRAANAGLVERSIDVEDHRVVRVELTAKGERCLLALAAAHLEELSRVRPRFDALWRRLPGDPLS